MCWVRQHKLLKGVARTCCMNSKRVNVVERRIEEFLDRLLEANVATQERIKVILGEKAEIENGEDVRGQR